MALLETPATMTYGGANLGEVIDATLVSITPRRRMYPDIKTGLVDKIYSDGLDAGIIIRLAQPPNVIINDVYGPWGSGGTLSFDAEKRGAEVSTAVKKQLVITPLDTSARTLTIPAAVVVSIGPYTYSRQTHFYSGTVIEIIAAQPASGNPIQWS